MEGQVIWTFFAETLEEAEERRKRMVKAQRKIGVNASTLIVPSEDLTEATRQALVGKGFNLVRQDSKSEVLTRFVEF